MILFHTFLPSLSSIACSHYFISAISAFPGLFAYFWDILAPFWLVFTRASHAEARLSYKLDVCPSICQSVSLSVWLSQWHVGIVSKRLNLSSNCLHCVVAPWSSFLRSKLVPKFQSEHPNGGRVKCKGQKVAISDQYLAIARKRLKTDGYMLRRIWRALNPLFIHLTFTAIVPGAYPGPGEVLK